MTDLTDEKREGLLPSTMASPQHAQARKRCSTAKRLGALLGLVSLICFARGMMSGHGSDCGLGSLLGRVNTLELGFLKSSDELCPQADPLTPSKDKDLWDDVAEMYGSQSFQSKAVEWLGGAVRVP